MTDDRALHRMERKSWAIPDELIRLRGAAEDDIRRISQITDEQLGPRSWADRECARIEQSAQKLIDFIPTMYDPPCCSQGLERLDSYRIKGT